MNTRAIIWTTFFTVCAAPLHAGEFPFTKELELKTGWLKDFAWIDLDQDRDMDLVVVAGNGSNPNYGWVKWFENREAGDRWVERSIDELLIRPTGLDIVDVDGDEDLDILVTGSGRSDGPGRGGTHVLINVSGAKIWKPVAVIEGEEGGAAAFGDIDGDGDEDVLFAGRKASWAENEDGKGTKWGEATQVFDQWLKRARLFDWDGDGDLDIVGSGPKGLTIRENDGGGAFGATTTPWEGGATTTWSWTDWDGDDDEDLLIGNYKSVSLFINGGKGEWTEQKIPTGKLNNLTAAVLDVDNDGQMDIVLGSASHGTGLTWLKRGEGELKLIDKVSETERVAPVDFDGDGDHDLMVLKRNGSKVRVLENKSKKRKKK